MGEILFRGKNKLRNWCYGSLHMDSITGSNKCHINSRISADNPNFIEVEELGVDQITDSVDINGNNIWEGDLVNQKSVLVDDEETVQNVFWHK